MPKYIDADEFVRLKREWYCKECQKRKGMKRGKLQFIYEIGDAPCRACDVDDVISDIEDFPAADVEPKQKWIPVTERPPKDNVPVNVVWVNHDPEVYYTDIKDKSFTATAVYFRKRWYWWSATIEDILNEYGDIPQLRMDPGIEITHWSPIPEPPKEEYDGTSRTE